VRNQRQGLPAGGIPLHPGVALKLHVLCPASSPAVRDQVHESGTTRQPSPGHVTTTRPGLWNRAASLARGVDLPRSRNGSACGTTDLATSLLLIWRLPSPSQRHVACSAAMASCSTST
jgi:hypothetical protein